MDKGSPAESRTALAVFGSPHPKGMTASLLAAFEDGLPPGTAVTRFDCFSRMPHACTGCAVCAGRDGCVFGDLDDYDLALRTADALVFAVPVYNMAFPSPVKALIDRSQRYWNARFARNERFSPKDVPVRPAVLLTSAGSHVPGTALEEQLRPMLTLVNAFLKGCVHYTGADAGTDGAQAFLRAHRIASELFSN